MSSEQPEHGDSRDSGEDEQEQSDRLQDAIDDLPDDEITVENIGGDEERAFDEAWGDMDKSLGGVAVKRNLNISRLDADRVNTIMEKLRAVEQSWADAGDHQGAKSASDMRNKIKRAAINEGILDG